MKRIIFAVLLAASLPAFSVQAILVSQQLGHSVTGLQVRVCVYSTGSQQFSTTVEGFASCPFSVEVR